ncbi:MAG TPA: RluA family pseudouridine synthase [Candidatus Baltobacteraceae bacterium]|nr:RluA family pseudouridine synthase [Candidatus Baltobacteraceae bacterium]
MHHVGPIELYTLRLMTIPPLKFVVPPEAAGQRLDRFVSVHSREISRTRVQELIEGGLVTLNGKPAKDSQKVRSADVVEVTPTPRPAMRAEAEHIPLDILYEDDDLIAVDKAAGMTVHAGAGNSRGTLVNALLGRGQALSQGGDPLRPGIVHRIDKETSGILLVAKNDFAHAKLADAFRERKVQKTYLALLHGALPEDGGRIELPIARDPVRRNRMTARRAASLPNARQARTDWRALARIDSTTLVEVHLHTGRTHQIRVHFSALRHPVVGDTLYGASSQLQVADTSLPPLGRNFLHAAKLGFQQPRTGQPIQLTAPLPIELRAYLSKLAAAAGESPSRIDAALKGFL